MTLQDRMKVFRALNRISQKELAKLCGVSAQTIWSVEKGDQEPSEITRIKIELVVGRDDNGD